MPNWEFAEAREAIGIHLSGTDTREEQGFVIKEVLRTGEWGVIPTRAGVVKKPLRVVRDGKSSAKDGIIAMEELVANFQNGAIDRVQIPLSDDENDHKNTTRNNTGYVRDLWIQDTDNGSKLVAKMEFTEPEVKEKVLRGTYADVSCGIPWSISSRGQKHGAVLEHVAITNRPFIDGLGPFLAASDSGEEAEEVEVAHFGSEEIVEEVEKPSEEEEQQKPVELSADEIRDAGLAELAARFGNGHHYGILEAADGGFKIHHATSEKTWTAPYKVEEGKVSLSNFSEWTVEEGEVEEPPAPQPEKKPVELSNLEKARRLREIRLSQPSTTKREKEANVPQLTREELAALELSDDARAAIQSVLDENARLAAQTRQADAERRVEELKDLGLSERPGFLKLYRDVMLSDDGGAAVILSDNNTQTELSALEILDRAVEALKGSDEKVHLSDQALASGNDERPPANADNENVKPLEERLAETREALFGTKK